LSAIKLYFLSSLFFVAGIIHLITPDVFFVVIPEMMPNKYGIVILTGVIEIILAFGLIQRKSRDLSARFSALYLLCLLPIHVYVSWEEKTIFGINSPFLLWGRTLFQFVLVYLALSLQERGPLIFQRWKDVIFLHYKASAQEIQKLVPFPLDLYEGAAVISIVPFQMDRIRFPFLPWIPGVSKLWELNLRTYVTVNGVKGVFFFTLDTDSLIGEKIARSFFHLPYHLSSISAKVQNKEYYINHNRGDYSFELKGSMGEERKSLPFELWTLERYHLFLKHKEKCYQGTVTHRPWPLQDLKITMIEDQFSRMLGPNLKLKFIASSYTKDISVWFAPFKQVPAAQ
jgi:uncharacterized protein YqjF (DUF2071 family)